MEQRRGDVPARAPEPPQASQASWRLSAIVFSTPRDISSKEILTSHLSEAPRPAPRPERRPKPKRSSKIEPPPKMSPNARKMSSTLPNPRDAPESPSWP